MGPSFKILLILTIIFGILQWIAKQYAKNDTQSQLVVYYNKTKGTSYVTNPLIVFTFLRLMTIILVVTTVIIGIAYYL